MTNNLNTVFMLVTIGHGPPYDHLLENLGIIKMPLLFNVDRTLPTKYYVS